MGESRAGPLAGCWWCWLLASGLLTYGQLHHKLWLDVWLQHSAAVGACLVNLATILLPSTPDLPARRAKLAGSPAGFAVCALKRWV